MYHIQTERLNVYMQIQTSMYTKYSPRIPNVYINKVTIKEKKKRRRKKVDMYR